MFFEAMRNEDIWLYNFFIGISQKPCSNQGFGSGSGTKFSAGSGPGSCLLAEVGSGSDYQNTVGSGFKIGRITSRFFLEVRTRIRNPAGSKKLISETPRRRRDLLWMYNRSPLGGKPEIYTPGTSCCVTINNLIKIVSQ